MPAPATTDIGPIAAALARAERDRAAIAPLTESWPELDVATAYRVQQANVAERTARGERVVGYKIGLTSLAMQRQLGVDQPDFGTILDSMVIPSGGEVRRDDLILPRVEAEIAFELGRDLAGADVGPAEVLAATRSVVPALEIIDSRVRDWKIGLVDTIADNASSARIVVGDEPRPVEGLDLRTLGVVASLDGNVVATGAGAASLGDPLVAVAWLARTLTALGGGLPAGAIVMSGAVHAAFPLEPGTTVSAEVHSLGSVTVRVV